MINTVHLLVTVYNKSSGFDYIVHEHDTIIEQICVKLMSNMDLKHIDEGCSYLLSKYNYIIKKQLNKVYNEELTKLEIINSTITDLIIIKNMIRDIENPEIELAFERET